MHTQLPCSAHSPLSLRAPLPRQAILIARPDIPGVCCKAQVPSDPPRSAPPSPPLPPFPPPSLTKPHADMSVHVLLSTSACSSCLSSSPACRTSVMRVRGRLTCPLEHPAFPLAAAHCQWSGAARSWSRLLSAIRVKGEVSAAGKTVGEGQKAEHRTHASRHGVKCCIAFQRPCYKHTPHEVISRGPMNLVARYKTVCMCQFMHMTCQPLSMH